LLRFTNPFRVCIILAADVSNISPPSSGSKKQAEQETSVKAGGSLFFDPEDGGDVYITCFHAGFLLNLFFDPEDGGDMFLRNVG
jgi:hypothetical protein